MCVCVCTACAAVCSHLLKRVRAVVLGLRAAECGVACRGCCLVHVWLWREWNVLFASVMGSEAGVEKSERVFMCGVRCDVAGLARG